MFLQIKCQLFNKFHQFFLKLKFRDFFNKKYKTTKDQKPKIDGN